MTAAAPIHWQADGRLACGSEHQKYGQTVYVGDLPVRVTDCCTQNLAHVTCDGCKQAAADAGIVGTPSAGVTP